MKIAFLFPGQGSQFVGMGKDIYEEFDEAKKVYDKVKEITKIDIAKISFEDPEGLLNTTKYTQIAVLTMSLAILEVLKNRGMQAEFSAGLSLGEYTSLIYSGALDFEDGINIVKKRGEYMEKLVPKGDWKMAAILGLDSEQVEKVCKKVINGFAVPANYNCKNQIVISGENDAILQAEQYAKEIGAKKVIILNTSGPFHTKKLVKSSEALKKELLKYKIHAFNSKVFKNIDGKVYKDSDDVKDILAKHIINPVRFSSIIENMLVEGIDTFVEIGPGKSLSGFVKRMITDKNIKIININNVESLEEVIINE